jgi:hypothetical protein
MSRIHSNFGSDFGVVLAAALFGVAIVGAGCDKEKSGAEKLADQIAASNSAQKAATSASNSKPDPAEQKYKERKASLERTVTDMKADESHVMAKDPAATPGILRHYFETGPDGDKLAADLEAKRKKDGEGGIVLKNAKIIDTRLAGNLEDAEIDVVEKDTAKGADACLLHTQKWKYKEEKWLFQQELNVKKVDCE